jgi:iron complex transport system substrate-binding protein
MRVASLLPSATEIVCALGLADALVGVSHECDYPPEAVRGLPRLTRSAIPSGPGVGSAEIDAAVAERLRRGEGLYVLEEELLAGLRPDLVITQQLCDVCAVSYAEVCRAAARLPGEPPVLSLQPANIAGIFDDICTVARALGVPERGERFTARLRERLDRAAVPAGPDDRPRVFALEWLDPPYIAGHWVPEMIHLAGGRDVLGRPGEKSRRVAWEQVLAAQPEVILLIPCGYTAQAAEREFAALAHPPGWEALPAVQSGRVHALEANDFFSRPAPRVVDGVELLAGLLHPNGQD